MRNIRYENIVMTQVLANVLDYDAELRRIRLYMQAPWHDDEAVFFLSNSQANVKLEDVIVYWSEHKEVWGSLTEGGCFQSENVIEIETDQDIASMVLERAFA